VYDRLTKTGFDDSGRSRVLNASVLQQAESSAVLRYEVFMQPLMGRMMLSLGPIEQARVLKGGTGNASLRLRGLSRGAAGELLSATELTGPIRYRVHGQVSVLVDGSNTGPSPELSDLQRRVLEHFLRLPEGIDERIAALAQELTQGMSDPVSKANALRRFLDENFEYTLSQPNGDKPDPLAAFVFDDRTGHCEYFATAYATMLRAVGVPSRVVGGYAGGLWDRAANIAVFTSNHAHAWVEWYRAGAGWVMDDPTPAAHAQPNHLAGLQAWMERVSRYWDDNVVDYGISQQIEIFRSVSQPFRGKNWRWRLPKVVWAVPVLVFVLLAWWFFRHRRARFDKHPIGKALEGAIERFAGEAVECHLTLREAADSLQGDPAQSQRMTIARGVRAYEYDRFGPGLKDTQVRMIVRDLRKVSKTHRSP